MHRDNPSKPRLQQIVEMLLTGSGLSIPVRLALAACTGLLAAFAWPPGGFNFILLIAFVPLLIALHHSKGWGAYLVSYAGLFIFSTITMRWLLFIEMEWLGRVLIYMAIMVIPALMAVPFWVTAHAGRVLSIFSWLLLPFAYAGFETLHYHWELGFTWLHLGLGFANSPWLMGTYPFAGLEGGTVIILLSNVFVFFALCKGSGRKSWLVAEVVLLLVAITPYFLQAEPETNIKTARVGVFAPTFKSRQWYANEMQDHLDDLATALEATAAEPVDLVVCPEGFLRDFDKTPVFINTIEQHPAIKQLAGLSSAYKTTILTGCIGIKLYKAQTAPSITAREKQDGLFFDMYNLALAIGPGGDFTLTGKQHMVPFMERVPFLEHFAALENLHLSLNQAKGSYAYWPFSRLPKAAGMVVTPLICQESLFPEHVNEMVKNGSNIIAELSNGTWSSIDQGIYQHHDYAKVTAIQMGRSYLRSSAKAGNEIYLSNGKKAGKEINIKTGKLIVAEIPLEGRLTKYAILGGYIRLVCLLMLGLQAVAFTWILFRSRG